MAVETIGANTATSLGTSIAPSATANTKGSWVQLTASSTIAAKGVIITIDVNTATVNRDYLLDIGTGAAGSEVVLVANIPAARGTSGFVPFMCFLPIAIPSGTRIAARCQGNGASSGSLIVTAHLLGVATNTQDMTRETTYGAATADSDGIAIDPGATPNTKGSWVEIIASLTNPIDHLALGIGNNNELSRTDIAWLVDVGTGAAGSEVVVLANTPLIADSTSDTMYPKYIGPFPISISAGTRIAVRAQASSAAAGDRIFSAIVFGFDGPASGGAGGGIRLAGYGGLAA